MGPVLKETTGLSHDWSRWLAQNRMLGVADAELVAVMTGRGVPEAAVRAEVVRLAQDPCFQAGRWIGERLRKLESILAIQEQLRDLARAPRAIERRRQVSPTEFFDEYYAKNRPLVLIDFADGWPAQRWTVDSLQTALGDEAVEVMSGREEDERYELNAERHRSSMPFNEYANHVRATECSNDIYLVANNRLLDLPAAAALWPDFDIRRPPLDGEAGHGQAFLWLGPAGTVTPLHHDLMNVLFVQLHGRKQFTLIAPGFTPRLYNEAGVHAAVDPGHPDYVAHPTFRGVPTTTVVVEPGETLFVPVGWWHQVESLDVSISLSFTNFSRTNQFSWQNPSGLA